MPTVFLIPSGTDSADAAAQGDYLLRPTGDDLYEVGRVGETCTWLGSLKASLLPDLPSVDGPQEAPQQPDVLSVVQAVETAERERGA
jgi:hypothetical protein